MRIAVLGTGAVGRALGTKLRDLGHDVMLGARDAGNPRAAEWAEAHGGRAGDFATAAAFAELVFNCTAGGASLAALEAAGAANLDGKILVDVSNPLDFSAGFPPTLSVCNTDSLGEQIQRAFPGARVVKTLNTVGNEIMVDPGRLEGQHCLFLSGDDAAAKAAVRALLESFGWQSIIDLGGIGTARGTEQWLPLWVRLYGTLGTSDFNIAIVRRPSGT